MNRQLWSLLEVRNIQRSIAFYRDQLGFTLLADDGAPGGQIGWCRLERDGASLMLQGPGDESAAVPDARRGEGVCFYSVCDDADAIYAELLYRSVPVRPPSIAYYGIKQLFVPEPDGYEICFESPTRAWNG